MSPSSEKLQRKPPDPEGLAQNALFRGLTAQQMQAAVSIPELVSLGPGETIFDENESPAYLYLIMDGRVRISKRGRGGRQETLADLGAGDFFGEMAVYDPGSRSARASTTAPTRLARIEREGLAQVIQLAPLEVTENLTRGVIRRLRYANERFIQQVLEAERLSLVGSVATGMAHDLKNSIGIIRGATSMLENLSGTAEALRWTSMIQRNVELMFDVIQELLDFSRGKVETRPEPINVDKMVAILDEQILVALPQRGVQVERSIMFSGTVVLDWHRFLRVLINLIKNAVDAMPDGGELRLSVEERGNMVVFGVSDTGAGISSDLLPRIFDLFVTHGKKEGTGLGLAMAKSVVEAHHGTIRVESIVGEGSYFEIAVPRLPPSEGERPS